MLWKMILNGSKSLTLFQYMPIHEKIKDPPEYFEKIIGILPGIAEDLSGFAENCREFPRIFRELPGIFRESDILPGKMKKGAAFGTGLVQTRKMGKYERR